MKWTTGSLPYSGGVTGTTIQMSGFSQDSKEVDVTVQGIMSWIESIPCMKRTSLCVYLSHK